MKPAQLRPEDFANYPAQARSLAVNQLPLLRTLPLIFAALLLREVRDYDWRFPPERQAIEDQFSFLSSLAPPERENLLRGFAEVRLPDSAQRIDWVAQPQPFLDALTAALWSTHQIDGFRQSAKIYASAWRKACPEPQPAIPRLAVVVLGADLQRNDYPLFRKLRSRGVFVPQVSGDDGWATLTAMAQKRAQDHPATTSHIYIDGGEADSSLAAHLATTSYAGLASVREQLLQRISTMLTSANSGPEQLRTAMAEITPQSLRWPATTSDEAFRRFQLDVLTEGSGTQIFSTTFVQWAAREALRRAQPLTLVTRFTPRQHSLNMNEMLSGKTQENATDPAGSLVDADMGAFYVWIDQQRLAGAEESAFLAWSQAHRQAVLMGPAVPHNTVAGAPMTMRQMLAQLT
jgi:hypothetical protein